MRLCILPAACLVKNRLLGSDQTVSKIKRGGGRVGEGVVGGAGGCGFWFLCFAQRALSVNTSVFSVTQRPAFC